jgi:hypothetical protein
MNLRVRYVVLAVCLILAFGSSGIAQNAPAKAAAPDYSGRYSFLQDGEDVQINQTGDKVDGYVERFGTTDSDRETLLQQTFTKASLTGDRLTFSTKPVHAVWYEFSGKVERGAAKTRAEDGYYQIAGTLTEHTQKDGKDASARSRQVTLKLFADEEEPAKK